MTDEERQKLCEDLRNTYRGGSLDKRLAANEIERLAALVQQPDAEPVADEEAVDAAFDKWAETRGYGRMGTRLSFHAGVEFGLRHAHPPRPDVSAGLIAAAELPAAARDNEITFWYKNHRGENAIRFVRVLGLRWGTNEYYTEEQWLLRAYDYDRHAEREFAVKDMSPITADRARAADRSEK